MIVKSTGSWYEVLVEGGEKISCRIVGKFRLDDKPLTNPIAVGDNVRIQHIEEEGTAMITEILPRKNYVVRQSPRKKHHLHIIAANVDQAIVVVTIVEPLLKQGFIDRFLLMTEPYHIPVRIVFNKSDLYDDESLLMYEYLKTVYENIGYEVCLVSAEKGDGIEDLKFYLEGKRTLISGQSGVGKSTLLNALAPGLDLKTAELSDYSGKGQHTTTFAELFVLGSGTQIIDTPGIKTLSFNHFEVADVAHNFRELFIVSQNCKFGDCTHRNEPKCAVKSAVEEGSISELRYHNYLKLIEEVEDQNYWERMSDY